MKKALILAFFVMFGCGSDNKDEQLKALQQQNALLQKQIEATTVEKQKEVKAKRQAELTRKALECVTIAQIKKDLIGQKVITKQRLLGKDYWEFAALSEFGKITTESQYKNDNICERTLQINLTDYTTNEPKFMRLYVRYANYGRGWMMEKIECLEFR
jgi:hypothetical protein